MTAVSLDLAGAHRPDDVLLWDERSGALPAGRVRAEMQRWMGLLDAPAKMLVRIDAPRHSAGLAAYLAALALGHAVLPVDGATPARAEQLDRAFRPEVTVLGDTVRPGAHRRAGDPPPHAQLGLLLPTSGSSGEPKVVRLSYDNLRANAEAIAGATGITPADRVATSLPVDYAFGLSLVNSHLVGRASLAVVAASPVTRRFWHLATAAAAGTVGLVPSAVRTLLAWRWAPDGSRVLRRVLLAGGPLDAATILRFADTLGAAGADLVSMYGQAEATARISCLPPRLLREHPGSVGRAVPGHEVGIEPAAGGTAECGEIVFHGPSVMMGYGRGRDDLALGDVQGPTLRTGDLGRLADGLLYVVGRVDRQVKVLGRRVDLAAVEAAAAGAGSAVAAVPGSEDQLVLLVEDGSGGPDADADLRTRVADAAGLPAECVRLRRVSALPRTASGKIAYGRLAAAADPPRP